MPSVSGNINLLHPVSGVIPVYVDSGIPANSYRLLENGDYFLLENGDYKILG